MLFWPAQTPPPMPPPTIQTAPTEPSQAEMEARLKARDWAGLADWFETQSPTVRGRHHVTWLQALQRSQRWARLVEICEALQPQLEATSGPRLGIYRYFRAQGLSGMGRHAASAAAYAENGRLGAPDGLSNACIEARLAMEWEAMLAYAEELLVSRPEHALGLSWKGEALARLARFPEAEPVLRAALVKDPKLAYAWNNLGRCLTERKAWVEAVQALDQALVLEPRQMEAHFNRGRARFELKQYVASRDDFKAALALEPENLVLAENLRQAERYAAMPTPAPPALGPSPTKKEARPK